MSVNGLLGRICRERAACCCFQIPIRRYSKQKQPVCRRCPEQMSAIKSNVFDYFGVNTDIMQNKAYGDAWSAFYEGAIEPFAIQFSDVSTKMFFTERERASGSFLMATANRLQYMSNTEKLNVSAQMADRGIMNRDEIREIWNLPPLPNGEGQAYTIRGEYYLLGPGNAVTKKGDDLTSGT